MLTTTTQITETTADQTLINMGARQKPLQARYVTEPADAWITDHARTSSKRIDATMPLYGEVLIDSRHPMKLDFAVHRAVGGESDRPIPGELLSAALASCLDSTIRILANRFGIALKALEVQVASQVDVRGTLCVDLTVPVGFQKIDVRVHVETVETVAPEILQRLLKSAEHSCVVLQTLRHGPEITVRYE